MNFFRYLYSLALLALTAPTAAAEAPEGYYSACEGKTGQALLTALHQTIADHNAVSYSGLWTLYKTSDTDENGQIWDMYSTKRWTYQSEQCGSYKYIGDCYNREHSMPKSWFNDATPMYTDAFHIYPTDGVVNGQRSNYPFGECEGGSYVSSRNGVQPLGRLGTSTFEGYSGTVFEPDDMYKGDFARSYFYMAACYNDRIASWVANEEAKPMLAGNSYPVFNDWAEKLLLKWARQDEVSEKETKRNDAVYAAQNNRNPFIDHPELVEYIWGDKVGEPWHEAVDATPAFRLPVPDVAINLGYAAVGVRRSVEVSVKGANLESAVSLTVSGSGYSVSPATLTAAEANAGCTVTVSQLATAAGDAEGTLTLTSGTAVRTVDLVTTVEEGLPLFEASEITSSSFRVRWISLGDADSYTLDVRQGASSIPGYPRSVDAAAESHTVDGLDAETEYTFSIASGSLKSATLSVTTAALIPSIALLFDGELLLETTPGEPSQAAELLLEAENISADITVAVNAPFEVSTDKSDWGATATLDPEEDRFYLRLGAAEKGEYNSAITLTAGSYVNDDVEVRGIVADESERSAFIEDWENVPDKSTVKPYATTEFQGSACRWSVVNGGFGDGSQDTDVNGTTVLRMKAATASSASQLAMAEDKAGGIGSVTFDAARWPNKNDKDITLTVEYSDDMGTTWTPVGTATVSETTSGTFTAEVNRSGNGRVRFTAAAGSGRWFIDNIAITDYSSMSAVNKLDYHAWDAYCLNGRLAIESRDEALELTVYGMDGITYHKGSVGAGLTLIALPRGLYVVASSSFARRVLVK